MGNGAFTEAVLEALTTRADSDGNGVIGMGEMAHYVSERTSRITVGRQTPGSRRPVPEPRLRRRAVGERKG